MKRVQKAFLAFEGGVLLVGALLTYVWPKPPTPPLTAFRLEDLSTALFAFLPALTVALIATSKWGISKPGIRGIYQNLNDSIIGRYIRKGTWVSFLILSILAGLGEELLFRAFLQPYAGLWLTSLIFGALHAVSFAYFMIATVVGLYLGKLYLLADQSIFVVAFVHGLYDFVALLLYRRRMNSERAQNNESHC